jgi:hypothetical protein
MVEYIMEKGNLRDISCKIRDAGFDVSFRDCPAKGRTGGHPNGQPYMRSFRAHRAKKLTKSSYGQTK